MKTHVFEHLLYAHVLFCLFCQQHDGLVTMLHSLIENYVQRFKYFLKSQEVAELRTANKCLIPSPNIPCYVAIHLFIHQIYSDLYFMTKYNHVILEFLKYQT